MDVEWVECFMKCHPYLSLRKPHNTSLPRATSFNQKNATIFHNNYKERLVKFRFAGKQVYSPVETRVTAVVLAVHTLVQTIVKDVGHVVSPERGQLITVYTIVSATGNVLSHVFVLPYARINGALMSNAPEGSLGLANCQTSGSMIGLLFLKVLGHIKKVTL